MSETDGSRDGSITAGRKPSSTNPFAAGTAQSSSRPRLPTKPDSLRSRPSRSQQQRPSQSKSRPASILSTGPKPLLPPKPPALTALVREKLHATRGSSQSSGTTLTRVNGDSVSVADDLPVSDNGQSVHSAVKATNSSADQTSPRKDTASTTSGASAPFAVHDHEPGPVDSTVAAVEPEQAVQDDASQQFNDQPVEQSDSPPVGSEPSADHSSDTNPFLAEEEAGESVTAQEGETIDPEVWTNVLEDDSKGDQPTSTTSESDVPVSTQSHSAHVPFDELGTESLTDADHTPTGSSDAASCEQGMPSSPQKGQPEPTEVPPTDQLPQESTDASGEAWAEQSAMPQPQPADMEDKEMNTSSLSQTAEEDRQDHKDADESGEAAGEPSSEAAEESIYGNLTAISAARDRGELVEYDEDEDDIPPVYCRVLYDYDGTDEGELRLRKGAILELLTCDEDDDWWSGILDDQEGWFPASYVALLEPEEAEMELQAQRDKAATEMSEAERQKRAGKRAKSASELVSTEEDYVANLEMVVGSYVIPMRQRVGQLFDEQTVNEVFSNLEQIHQHNLRFLEDLRAAGPDAVGQCFINYAERFKMYTIYCNNHPKAVERLEKLMTGDLQLESFFEACRLLVECDIDLKGFLLKPIQRLCQYPLMLAELMKYTDQDHPDHQNLDHALQVMRDMATAINEDKRFKEEIIRLQKSLEGWKGPDISSISSRLIQQGPLTKISGRHMQERQFFLFDNLLIYCKRSLRGAWTVCGQIFTENLTILDLQDGTFSHGKTPINNAIKLYNESKHKWYVLRAATPEEKEVWLEAFLQERRKVEEDISKGIALINLRSNATDDDRDRVIKGRLDVVKKLKNRTLRRPRKVPKK